MKLLPLQFRTANTAKKNGVKIVVIGAGLSGLSATSHLIKNGFSNVDLLEATERYGGRIHSKYFGDACCELGAKWIDFAEHEESTYKLAKDTIGLSKILERDNTVYYNSSGEEIKKIIPQRMKKIVKHFCGGIKINEKFNGSFHNLNNIRAYFEAQSTNIVSPNFCKEERKTAMCILDSFLKELSGVYGCNLEYLHIQHLMKSPLSAISRFYIPNGLEHILHTIQKNINSKHLHLGKPVGQISWNDRNKALVSCMDGSKFYADHVICTIPLGVLKNFSRLMFRPMLPLEKEHAIKSLGFGNPVKIYFEFSKNINRWFIANLRFVVSNINFKTERKWSDSIIEISKLPSSDRVLEIFVGGGYYEEIEKLPDAELINEVIKFLRKYSKIDTVPYPTSILRSNWNTSPCFFGGKPYFSSQSTIKDVLSLSFPIGNLMKLLFAGDATIVNGFGTLNGARLSGIRAAECIINLYAKRI